MKVKIRKGDTVEASAASRIRQGEVINVFDDRRVVVQV
jgi:hypothetical protein